MINGKVFLGGKVLTMDRGGCVAAAVAVENGRIVAVGEDANVCALAGPDTEVIDLAGRTMIPGLIDTHCHLVLASRSHALYVDGHIPPLRSISELLARIAQKVASVAEDRWVIIHGSHFGERKFVEQRYPTLQELDGVAPSHPVLILDGRHTFRLNTAGLEVMGISAPDSTVLRRAVAETDPQSGRLSGVVKEARHLFPDFGVTLDEARSYVRDLVPKLWVSKGFTSAYTFADDTEFRVLLELEREGRLPLRVTSHFADSGPGNPRIEQAIALGLKSGFGSDWLRLGGVKIFVDGAYMSHTVVADLKLH